MTMGSGARAPRGSGKIAWVMEAAWSDEDTRALLGDVHKLAAAGFHNDVKVSLLAPPLFTPRASWYASLWLIDMMAPWTPPSPRILRALR